MHRRVVKAALAAAGGRQKVRSSLPADPDWVLGSRPFTAFQGYDQPRFRSRRQCALERLYRDLSSARRRRLKYLSGFRCFGGFRSLLAGSGVALPGVGKVAFRSKNGIIEEVRMRIAWCVRAKAAVWSRSRAGNRLKLQRVHLRAHVVADAAQER